MIRALRNFEAYLLALLMLGGCAGFRGGWESVPYIGDVAPTALPDAVQSTAVRLPLELPGLTLEVALDNRLRVYDTQVYFFALPLSADLNNTFDKNNNPQRTRLFVYVTAHEPGVIFRPTQAVLIVSGRRFTGVAASEFGQWNGEGRRVTEGGTWQRRPVGPERVLTNTGHRNYLSIDFETPPPSPESKDITVDLSRALIVPGHPALPLIRFAPVRWKQGYT